MSLEVRNLSWEWEKGRLLLSDITLEVRPGEVLGLIGPNGAGKTTLLRHLTGFLKPNQGTIVLQGKPLQSYTPRERARLLAYVPQQAPDGLDYTLQELVEMGRYPYAPSPSDRELVLRSLRFVGLEDFKDRLFPTLSGGEKHRGLFARALVQETPWLLLDEPAANLDPGHEQLLFEMLRELAAEGRGLLVVLHNLNAAAAYCDRLILMEGGQIRVQGPPEEVLSTENLRRWFRVDARVSFDPESGRPLVLPTRRRGGTKGPLVHLIGGGGSAVNLTRHLLRLGCRVTGGVVNEGDSDSDLWESLGIPAVRVPAFSPLTPEAVHQAKGLVEKADYTVLCDFPVGVGNLDNLEVACRSQRLVVIRGAGGRKWFAPGAEKRFEELTARPGVRVLPELQWVDELEGLISGE